MSRWLLSIALCCVAATDLTYSQSEKKNNDVQRGSAAVRGKLAMNPAIWSQAAYDNVWKRWGLKTKPADFDRRFRERYGLHEAPYKNSGFPMGLHAAKGPFFNGVANDCLMCHAGRVAGQTIIGMGNSLLELQGLFDEMSASNGFMLKFGFRFSHVRGTIDPVNPLAYLMEFRKPDLNLKSPQQLKYTYRASSDPPAWWLLKKKKTRQWPGNIDARSKRVDMVNLLTPFNSAAHIKKHEGVFADIHAFVLSVQAPKYPFAVDESLAARGRKIFDNTCSRCHGTYGAKPSYPNKVIPFKVIGTDPTLVQAMEKANLGNYNASWFAREKGPDGKGIHVLVSNGYQAPPLDGIWATAPYFHNSSVPTVYHVLNSRARPKYFTRSFRTEKEDYDQVHLGLKFTTLKGPANAKLPAIERRKIYDTTLPGQGNRGHTFADHLTDNERRAVIEYLKTL